MITSSCVNWWSGFHDHGHLCQLAMRSLHWLSDVMNITRRKHCNMIKSWNSSVLQLKNVVDYSLDCEITCNCYLRRMLWVCQPSHRKRVIIKIHLGYSKGICWGVWIKSRICQSAWRIDTLGPTRWYYIHKAAQRVTRSRGWNITERVEQICR